jgi:hypothetical protein
VGSVHDVSFSSNMAVAKFLAAGWQDDAANTGSDHIFVAGLDVLRISGNLEADVTVASDARVSQFTVQGTLLNSIVKSFGDINTMKLGSIVGSSVFAGVDAKPDSLGDFASRQTIGSFSVTGNFADSIVAAAQINSIVLGSANKTAGFDKNGFYADAIKSYVRKGAGGTKLTRLDEPGTFDTTETDKFEVVIF